jgi:hypothetical protein
MCAQVLSISQNSHDAAMKRWAKVMQGSQADLECARWWLMHSIAGALLGLKRSRARSSFCSLDRRSCVIERTNRDHIFLLLDSTL